jgi:hypothetical protein
MALPYTLLAACYSGYQYIWGEKLNYQTTTLRRFVLTAPVTIETTAGKNRTHYYNFELDYVNKPCRLLENDYRFATDCSYLQQLKKGDTVGLYFPITSLPHFYRINFFTRYNRIVNIHTKQGDLYSFDYRYEAQQQSNKNWLQVAIILFAINILLVVVSVEYQRNKRHRSIT